MVQNDIRLFRLSKSSLAWSICNWCVIP